MNDAVNLYTYISEGQEGLEGVHGDPRSSHLSQTAVVLNCLPNAGHGHVASSHLPAISRCEVVRMI